MSTENLKAVLFESALQHKSQLDHLLAKLSESEPGSPAEYQSINAEVISIIDGLVDAGDWESSLFLRKTIQPLVAVRQSAAALLAQSEEGTAIQSHEAERQLAEDETLVYVSLFQSQGHDLNRWALHLGSLESHLLGRPVYATEEEAQQVIRQKVNKASEAYVIVAVKQSAIQDFAYQSKRVDRHGNVLLSLQARAVKPENIVAFVHQGIRYKLRDGELIPNSH